jgi:hypothetical protein
MPPEVLRKALGKLQAEHELRNSAIPSILRSVLDRFPKMAKRNTKNPGYAYQGAQNDRLFAKLSQHVGGVDCRNCQESDEISRDLRDSTDPEIHYGVIASGNALVKNASERDEILGRLPEHVRSKCFCIEIEAAGLMNTFPCMVIRGICDYGDSHKTAMLSMLPVLDVTRRSQRCWSRMGLRSTLRADTMTMMRASTTTTMLFKQLVNGATRRSQ